MMRGTHRDLAHYSTLHIITLQNTIAQLHHITFHYVSPYHITCIVDICLSQALQLVQQASQVNYHSVAHHTVRFHIQYTCNGE